MMAEGGIYVDVRTVEEFEEGHPAGSINIPLAHRGAAGMMPNDDFARSVRAVVSTEVPVILGCKSGGRSMRAADILVASGFARVFDQRAGWDGVRDAFGRVVEPGWARLGLPGEVGQPRGRSWLDVLAKMPK